MKLSYGLILVFLTPLLASCDQLGIETPAAEQARLEAEGKAIGSGCRQTGRALEDCYLVNRKSPKAAIFAGWREMDAYMRENKIEDTKPDPTLKLLPGKAGAPKAAETGAEADAKKAQPTDAGVKPADTAGASKEKPAPTH